MNISRVENEKGLFVVEEYSCQYRALGSPLCVGRRLYFAAAQVVSASAVRIKKVAPGQFLISILDYEERRDEWTGWEGFAFVKLDALRASQSYCMRLPLGIRSAQVTRGDLVERLRTLLLGGGGFEAGA
ncbi:hypothetical protein O4H66_11680 [Comamonadaceae bacterium G21597-S1]|nr:hypothetical protein [Comamonadaceae bacterium G21597-S1]